MRTYFLLHLMLINWFLHILL